MKKKLFIPVTLVFLLLAGWIAWGNKALTVTELTVSSADLPESFSGLRIAHISDLHNAEFGEGNEKLLALIKAQEPDIIVITGDLIDSRRTDVGIALEFAEKARNIAPVYYTPGNHEARIPEEYAILTDGLREYGITVLEDETVVLEKDGDAICLAGMVDHDFFRGLTDEEKEENVRSRLSALLAEREEYTLLLAHRPEFFEIYAACGADFTMSGHVHGGQIRLPLIGGLASFGRPDAGLYTDGDAAMAVSRGLGNSLFPFRVNNCPEVAMIILQKGE